MEHYNTKIDLIGKEALLLFGNNLKLPYVELME